MGALRNPRNTARRQRRQTSCSTSAAGLGAARDTPADAADRLLRQHYGRLRSEVIATVRGKLSARGLTVVQLDLEAWYNAAWHGLHAAVADGRETVGNPCGWLVVAMERRAIDELRRMKPERYTGLPEDLEHLAEGVVEVDFAGRLDDLDRIRQWRSGLRLRLSKRERQAAVLHFVHGLSRIETAQQLGVSARRADKIFDSITTKTAGLISAIEDGTWCEGERSLMVAFATGVLDPDGERYRIALEHVSTCTGCAAFVRRQRNVYMLVPAPAVAGVATAAGGGALGAALGLAEATSTGAGVGATAGGASLFGGLGAKTAVMCASAACLTGAGASVAVVEQIRQPTRPTTAQAKRPPPRKSATRPASASLSGGPATIALPSATAPTASTITTTSPSTSSGRVPSSSSPRRAPSPRERARARRAAATRQQENELGIESGGSAGTAPAPGSTPSSSGSPPAAVSSAAGGGKSDAQQGSTAAPPTNSSPPSGSSRASSGGGSSSPEIGIEP